MRPYRFQRKRTRGGRSHLRACVATAQVYGVIRFIGAYWTGRGLYANTTELALRGRPLGCYCRLDEPCHVDVLLRIAGRPLQIPNPSLLLPDVAQPASGLSRKHDRRQPNTSLYRNLHVVVLRLVAAIGFQWAVEHVLAFIIRMVFKPACMNEFMGNDDQPDTVPSVTLDLLVLFRTLFLSGGPDLRLRVDQNVCLEYLATVLNRRH
jgi:hypothetical protein